MPKKTNLKAEFLLLGDVLKVLSRAQTHMLKLLFMY